LNNANEKEKYQFHFETASFMDINDESIDLIAFLREEEGLFDFFKEELYSYISLSEDDIVDGKITASIYDLDDFREVFGDNGDIIYALLGAEGDPYDYFDSYYDSRVMIDMIPEFNRMPDRIHKILSALGITNEDEFAEAFDNDDEIYNCIEMAYNLALSAGASAEAYEDAISAIESADGEYKDQEIYITVTEDELLDNLDDYFYECNTYEDILKEMFKDKFEFREPYYGWSGFDSDTFYEELDWRLTEVAHERKENK
jgi:hypothetical protein